MYLYVKRIWQICFTFFVKMSKAFDKCVLTRCSQFCPNFKSGVFLFKEIDFFMFQSITQKNLLHYYIYTYTFCKHITQSKFYIQNSHILILDKETGRYNLTVWMTINDCDKRTKIVLVPTKPRSFNIKYCRRSTEKMKKRQQVLKWKRWFQKLSSQKRIELIAKLKYSRITLLSFKITLLKSTCSFDSFAGI